MTENRLLNEIKKVVYENLVDLLKNNSVEELAEALYSLQEEVSVLFGNNLLDNKEEQATNDRFDSFVKNVFKK